MGCSLVTLSVTLLVSRSTGEFVDCEEDLSDVGFHAFEAVLEVPGFFPGPP
jgi:hypothetical protein